MTQPLTFIMQITKNQVLQHKRTVYTAMLVACFWGCWLLDGLPWNFLLAFMVRR